MSSTCSLHKLPPELRRQIFQNVAAMRPWAKSLLAALRPTHKDSSLYSEYIQAYYDVKRCIISHSNVKSIERLSPETLKLVRALSIEFSIHTTSSIPVRFKRGFRYRTDARGRMTSHQTFYEQIQYDRILPRPTFETLVAFTNLKVLCLDAASVSELRFHQIEGIVKKAVQTCEKLERMEVASDVACIAWRDAWLQGDITEDTNDQWVARLNKGIRIKAKLAHVDSTGLSWPWFWQAPERKTLTWKG